MTSSWFACPRLLSPHPAFPSYRHPTHRPRRPSRLLRDTLEPSKTRTLVLPARLHPRQQHFPPTATSFRRSRIAGASPCPIGIATEPAANIPTYGEASGIPLTATNGKGMCRFSASRHFLTSRQSATP